MSSIPGKFNRLLYNIFQIKMHLLFHHEYIYVAHQPSLDVSVFGLIDSFSMSWSTEGNVCKCSACQEKTTCLVPKWSLGGPWNFFSRSKAHNFFSMQNCTEPRPIPNNIITSWNIRQLYFKQENIPSKK